MSWSAYTIAEPDQIAARLAALEPPGDPYPPRDDQVKAAKAAANSLLDSGAIGPSDALQVTISGHANDGHVTGAGQSGEVVTVTVSQGTGAVLDQYNANQAAAERNLQ